MSVTVMLGGSGKEMFVAIETAIALTKQLKTDLHGVCALPDPANSVVYITGAETVVLGGAAIDSLREAQDTLVADLQAGFKAQVDSAGSWLQADFKKQTGSVAWHGAAAASLADALVLPHGATDSAHPLNDAFEHILMEANLPLVLAPKTVQSSDTCLIAWDGSPIAARAVRMHLPLIRSFKQVVIAQNPNKLRHQWAPACGDSVQRLTAWLQEERLSVSHVEIDGPVSEGVLSAATEQKASLIVMGAYGHNRLGQMLFGGTTSKILHNDDAPALALCH